MKTSSRKSRVLALFAAAVSLFGGSVLVAGSFGSAGSVGAAGAPLPPSTAHGENFLFKSALDTNFCIDVAAGSTQGRSVILNQCTSVDTERWALTDNANGTNAIVDSEGMCVDSSGRKLGDGISLEVFDCSFHGHQRFSYTTDGLIQTKEGCLSVQGAVSGAAVSVVSCDSTKNHEVFKLAH
jgi:hypothetical protein